MIREQKYAITVGNKIYKYTEGIDFKNLQEINICPFNQCKFEYNNETIIDDIEDDTILIENAYKIEMKQNCANIEIILERNALIYFYNCKIEIRTLQNNKIIVEEKYFYTEKETDILQFE